MIVIHLKALKNFNTPQFFGFVMRYFLVLYRFSFTIDYWVLHTLVTNTIMLFCWWALEEDIFILVVTLSGCRKVLLVIVFLKICMYGHDIFCLLNLRKLCYILLFCTLVVLDGYKNCYVINSSRMLWICMFRYVNFLSIFIGNKALHLHVFTEEKDWPDIQLNGIIGELCICWNIPLSEVWAFIGSFMISNLFLEVDEHLKLMCISMEDIFPIYHWTITIFLAAVWSLYFGSWQR